jgi:hypothetical protein
MSEYIFELKNNLHPDTCKHIIEKFESDDNKRPGLIIIDARTKSLGVDSTIKSSVDLSIHPEDENWKDVDKHLYERLSKGMREYTSYMKNMWEKFDNEIIAKPELMQTVLFFNNDTGYQIQRIEKGGYYTWHVDYAPHHKRTIAFIWYLNTLNAEDGGTTDFLTQNVKIRPEEGKLIFFPATWTYVHKGSEVLTDNTKYIITGFITYE